VHSPLCGPAGPTWAPTISGRDGPYATGPVARFRCCGTAAAVSATPGERQRTGARARLDGPLGGRSGRQDGTRPQPPRSGRRSTALTPPAVPGPAPPLVDYLYRGQTSDPVATQPVGHHGADPGS
jgi:hypothetical protein